MMSVAKHSSKSFTQIVNDYFIVLVAFVDLLQVSLAHTEDSAAICVQVSKTKCLLPLCLERFYAEAVVVNS